MLVLITEGAELAPFVHVNVIDCPADKVGNVKNDEPLGEQDEHVGCAYRVVELVLELDHECLFVRITRDCVLHVATQHRTCATVARACNWAPAAVTTHSTAATSAVVAVLSRLFSPHVGRCVERERVGRMSAFHACV